MSEQPTYGSYPGGQYAPPPPPAGQNGMGTAAMVLGIIAVVLFWTIVVGFICGVLAIIFGIVGRGRARRGMATNSGQATAGLVTGIIGLVFALAIVILAASSPGNFCFHVGTTSNPCTSQ